MTNVSPSLLLSYYQDTAYFDYLRDMAERDPMLEAGKLGAEFEKTIETLIGQADSQQKQRVIDELTAKPLAELSDSERALLVAHTQSRS